MRENTDQKNPEYGHFLRIEKLCLKRIETKLSVYSWLQAKNGTTFFPTGNYLFNGKTKTNVRNLFKLKNKDTWVMSMTSRSSVLVANFAQIHTLLWCLNYVLYDRDLRHERVKILPTYTSVSKGCCCESL